MCFHLWFLVLYRYVKYMAFHMKVDRNKLNKGDQQGSRGRGGYGGMRRDILDLHCGLL